jgi:hypothetical protein
MLAHELRNYTAKGKTIETLYFFIKDECVVQAKQGKNICYIAASTLSIINLTEDIYDGVLALLKNQELVCELEKSSFDNCEKVIKISW